MKRSITWAAFLGLTLATIATAQNEEPPAKPANQPAAAPSDAPQAKPAEVEPAAQDSEAEDKPAVVTLLDAGAEPRQLLRLNMPDGAQHDFDVTWSFAMTEIVGEESRPTQRLPGWKMRLRTGAVPAEDEQLVRLRLQIGSMELLTRHGVPEQFLRTLQDLYDGMVHTQGICEVSRVGRVEQLEFTPEPATLAMVQQTIERTAESLKRLVQMLPEEPIGLGGKWAVELTTIESVVTVHRRIEYTITAVEGTQIDVKLEVQDTTEPQSMNHPRLPPDALKLTSGTGTGSGAMTIDLTRAFPVAYSLDTRLQFDLQLDLNGQQQESRRVDETSITIQPAEARAPEPQTQPAISNPS